MRTGRWRTLLLPLVVAACSSDALTSAEQAAEAFDRQPAGLVTDITELRVDTGADSCEISEAHGLSVALEDGSLLWRTPLPTPPGPIAVIGDIVYASGESLILYPPSVAGLDAATGAPLWQRFFETRRISVVEPAESPQVFTIVEVATGTGSVLDAAGTIVETVSFPAVPNHPGIRYAGSDYLILSESLVKEPLDRDAQGWSTMLPLDDNFTEVDSIEADDKNVLVRIRSQLGPNRRLVIVNAETGEIRWTLDGVRDARLAGNELLYDRRIPGNETLSREVVAVSVVDPADVRWSVPSTGVLGGYLGTTNDTHWFAIEGAEPGAVEIVDVDRDGPTTSPLPSGREQPFIPAQVIVDDDLVAVATESGLFWRRPDRTTRNLTDYLPIASIARTETTIVAVQGRGLVGCN